MLIPEDSPLCQPPWNLSRKQVLILDGIRYAAEIAEIAYERLFKTLQAIGIDKRPSIPRTRDIASAMADAWTIVDSAHRFHDLIKNLPGLRNAPWRRLLEERTSDVIELRDCVQHQLGEIDSLIACGGQIWGYLSWAEAVNGRHTGKGLMISPGARYVGDTKLFMGPFHLPFLVPIGNIRLNAFGREVYLGRTLEVLKEAIKELSVELANGNVRPVGQAASNRLGRDLVVEGFVQVEIAEDPTS